MRIKRAASSVVEADMTPMIDMTFQLIAFFMIVTNFEQTQADERVKLPADQLARPPLVPREDELVLNVGFIRNTKGEKVDPDPFVFLGDENVRVMDYGPYLKRERQVADLKHGDGAHKNMTVVIRADYEVPTGLIQELIKLSQEAGFEKFSFKAKSDDGAG
ncbi:biopolymer transporter ExbD [Maioricimonas sp. JC845]|uniref:ExbD/TolR family protein n=1 Tax=Maioricimonas sp. JC845 TaxID=3232138 RepID=UPI0034597EC5